ncbi:MAG: hypothetical protein AAFV49_23515, partial [Pseudomonadota bacterium]
MALRSGPRTTGSPTAERDPLFRPDPRTRKLISRSRWALLLERLARVPAADGGPGSLATPDWTAAPSTAARAA